MSKSKNDRETKIKTINNENRRFLRVQKKEIEFNEKKYDDDKLTKKVKMNDFQN